MTLTDPTGDSWQVRRRWLPWRPRRRDVDPGDIGDPGVASSDDLLLGLAVAVVVVVVVVVAPWVFVGAFLAVELVVLVLLLPLFVLLRALRIARWPVTVRHGRSLAWEESVRGWRGSRERMRVVAETIRAGRVDEVRPGPPGVS